MKFVRLICICKSISFFPHGYEPRGWLCCVRLQSLALTRKSLMSLLRLMSCNGCSFKDVIATGWGGGGGDEIKI